MKRKNIAKLLCAIMIINSICVIPVSAADPDIPVLDEQTEESMPEDVGNIPDYLIDEEGKTEETELLEEEAGVNSESEGIPFNKDYFPDEGFRECLQEYDTNGDGIFSKEELEKVTSIYAPPPENQDVKALVSDMTGIEYFPNLESVIFEGDKLKDNTELDLSNNPKLKILNVEGSGLTKINISANSELTDLALPEDLKEIILPENNNIERLKFDSIAAIQNQMSSFTKLKEFEWNGLYSLASRDEVNLSQIVNFGNYPELESLKLYNGNFRDLDVTQNPKLKTLKISSSYNAAPAFDFNLDLSNNDLLEELYLSVYALKPIDLSGKTNFKKLEITSRNSEIRSLDLEQCSNLEELSLSLLELDKLDISVLPKLKRLSVTMDSISELDLSQNMALRSLHVSSSSIGFLYAPDSQLTGISADQERDISLDSNFSYDLKKIPGYRDGIIYSVDNAKIVGSRIYPTSDRIFLKYHINANKTKGKGNLVLNVANLPKPAEIKGLAVTKRTSSTITCKWNKLSNPDGYVVYARNVDTNKLEKRVNVKKATSYKISGLKAGGKYAVIVRGYKKYNGKNRYSNYGGTSQKVVYTLPVKPKLKVGVSGSKVRFSWNNKKAASRSADSGYLIYYSTKKNGPYTRLTLVPDTKGSYVTTKLKKGKNYYFKMRAYIRNQNKTGTTFSGYSNVVNKKI